jgi:hypothetical protein
MLEQSIHELNSNIRDLISAIQGQTSLPLVAPTVAAPPAPEPTSEEAPADDVAVQDVTLDDLRGALTDLAVRRGKELAKDLIAAHNPNGSSLLRDVPETEYQNLLVAVTGVEEAA